MKRHQALKIIAENLKKSDLVISTTGMISRELFSTGERKGNFYMVGSMGLATPVALGITLANPWKKVISVEGDGSILLNLGIISLAAFLKPKNLLIVVLDNEVYASTGGQPTISPKVNLEKIAQSAGFRNTKKVETNNSFRNSLKKFLKNKGPSFLLTKVDKSQLEDVLRVSLTPEQIRDRFQKVCHQKP